MRSIQVAAFASVMIAIFIIPRASSADDLVKIPREESSPLFDWSATVSVGLSDAGVMSAKRPVGDALEIVSAATDRLAYAVSDGWAASIAAIDGGPIATGTRLATNNTGAESVRTTDPSRPQPTSGPPRARVEPASLKLTGEGHSLDGIASYYWQDQMTATGERFNKRDLTAAHRTLPFGTRVKVTRLDTGHSVVVRINDRGPFKPGRVIDLSERAAEDLGMTGRGLAKVQIEILGR